MQEIGTSSSNQEDPYLPVTAAGCLDHDFFIFLRSGKDSITRYSKLCRRGASKRSNPESAISSDFSYWGEQKEFVCFGMHAKLGHAKLDDPVRLRYLGKLLITLPMCSWSISSLISNTLLVYADRSFIPIGRRLRAYEKCTIQTIAAILYGSIVSGLESGRNTMNRKTPLRLVNALPVQLAGYAKKRKRSIW